jgi:sirohydrochlorin ferrochelatase
MAHATRVAAVTGLLALVAGCTTARPSGVEPDIGVAGVLLMAHGGTEEWNATVAAVTSHLGDSIPVTVAFGMADRASLQNAVLRLEAAGVSKIAVVRLFVSAHSFRHRTEYLLGLRADPPPGDHAEHGHLRQIERTASIALSAEGLSQSPRMGTVLADRVRALSRSPRDESVLILAHGMGDDITNEELRADLDRLADRVRAVGPFRSVRIETLREDWEEKRVAAERSVRAFVEAGHTDGGRVIVVPFRVAGFGPYRNVLAGLDYVADGKGLLPHPLVAEWIEEQVRLLLLTR